MANEPSELRRWAAIGAEQRLIQMSAEAEAIYRNFPELRDQGRELRAGASRQRANPFLNSIGSAAESSDGVRGGRKRRGPGRPRKRRMSPEARRRISEAQKARWAKQKAESARAEKGSSAKKK